MNDPDDGVDTLTEAAANVLAIATGIAMRDQAAWEGVLESLTPHETRAALTVACLSLTDMQPVEYLERMKQTPATKRDDQ